VSALRRILVETRTYHALATAWLERERPDLAVVYFQGTDTLGHVFAPFAPPRQPSVSPEDFERFSRVPERYFAEVDAMLGEYRKLAEASGAVLMIASDHGFRWREGRPEKLSSAAAATAGRWHRDEGIYLLWGPGVEPSPERDRGTVAQVCATLLSLAGLPPGKGMAGPLPGVKAATAQEVDYRASYRPSGATPETTGTEEEIAKLRALGYLGSRERSSSPSGETRTAASYNNEGLLWRERGDAAAAQTAFGQALAIDPGNVSAMWNLSDLLQSQGRDPDRSDELLLAAFAGGLPDGTEHVAARALQQSGHERSLRLLDRALAAKPGEVRLLLLRGRQRMERQRCQDALADFDAAARADPGNALAHASAGLARLCLGDAEGAARSLRRSLEIDPEQPEVRRALRELGGS
jgi:tetratricopeptide (TPR) repeat protein